MAFQKTNAAIVAETSTSYNSGVRIKQRPVMTLQNPIGTSRKEQYKRENNKRQNNTRLDRKVLLVKQNHAKDVEVHLIRDT